MVSEKDEAGSGPVPGAPARPWASSPEQVLAALGSGRDGISGTAATERLRAWGPNVLEDERAVRGWMILLRQFRSPLIYILIVAAAVTIALDEYVDAAVIALVLVFNAVVGFFQEYRAERSLEALRRLAGTQARTIRDGREREIDAAELVPGDVVLLEAGAKVPADCRILHATALEVDESLLTGESTMVAKGSEAVPSEAPIAERRSMVFMGTVLTRGHARAVVAATGAATELGHVAGTVQRIAPTETPLQRRMARFTRLVGAWALASAALGFGLGALHGEEPAELFRAMVALAVAALPEGLPIVLTVTLAISVSRMARRGCDRAPAAGGRDAGQLLGDRLRQDRDADPEPDDGGADLRRRRGLRAQRQRLPVRRRDPAATARPSAVEEGSPLELTLRAGALANEASLAERDGEPEVSGDPTEIALLVSAAKAGLYRDELEERFPRWADIPFDPDRRFAATFNRREDGRARLRQGGAGAGARDVRIDAAGDRIASTARRSSPRPTRWPTEGLRVLAMAYRDFGPGVDRDELISEHPTELTFLGLQGMMDPPREEAREAVAQCRRAGIRAVMITGDHASTALAIAVQLGIAGEDGARP